MQFYQCLVTIALSFISPTTLLIFAENDIRGSSYTELDAVTFSPFIEQYDLTMINFHAPWCGHCKVLEKSLKAVGVHLSSPENRASSIRIGSFDATLPAHTQLIEDIGGIDGYPTICVFKNGRRIADYRGSRRPSDIVEYLDLKYNSIVKNISSKSTFDHYLSRISNNGIFSSVGSTSLVICLFPHMSTNTTKLIEDMIESVATKLDSIIFLLSSNKDVISELQSEYNLEVDLDQPSLVVFAHNRAISEFNNNDSSSHSNNQYPVVSGIIKLHNNISENFLISNILRMSQPVLIMYSKQVHAFLQYIPVKKHVLVFTQSDDHINAASQTRIHEDAITASSLLVTAIEEVAGYFRGDLLFMIVDSHKYQLLQFFEINPSTLPQIVIADMSNPLNMKRYIYDSFLDNHNETSIISIMDTDIIADGFMNNDYSLSWKDIISDAFSHSKRSTSNIPAISKASNGYVINVPFQRGLNSEHMNVNTKYSPELLKLYFKAYLSNLVLPSIRSELEKESNVAPAPTTAVADTGTNTLQSGESATGAGDSVLDFAVRGVVNRLIGANFWNMVMNDNSTDFFIFFQAPWCGHCKQIEPVIADLAKYYIADRSMRIGRLDTSKNDINHDTIHIRAYPAFYLFLGKVKSNPVEYDGERSVKAISQFIANERSKYRKLHTKQWTSTAEAHINKATEIVLDISNFKIYRESACTE